MTNEPAAKHEPDSTRTAALHAPNTCRDASTSTSAQRSPAAALDGTETALNRHDKAFRPKLVRTGFYVQSRVAHYNIVGNNLELLAQMNLAIRADNQDTLETWDDQLRAHVEFCWQLAFNDTGTAMDILRVTLGQIPGYGPFREPRLTNTNVFMADTRVRTFGTPIPRLWLPQSSIQ